MASDEYYRAEDFVRVELHSVNDIYITRLGILYVPLVNNTREVVSHIYQHLPTCCNFKQPCLPQETLIDIDNYINLLKHTM